MRAPNRWQLELLRRAVPHLDDAGYETYLHLKGLLRERPAGYQVEFRRGSAGHKGFEAYYGLGAAGVTEAFKGRYFDLLFGLKLEEGADPHTPILRELYDIPRRQGDRALQCCFVSKLVSIHDENHPIFDRFVSEFFGLSVPATGSVDFRIAGFVDNLRWLRETYRRWSDAGTFRAVLARARDDHPALQACADARVADFLVWTVGHRRLWSEPAAERIP